MSVRCLNTIAAATLNLSGFSGLSVKLLENLK